MATYDVSGLGSQVLGIAGMGISVGLLAGMARNIQDITYSKRPAPRVNRSGAYQYKPYKAKSSYKPYKPAPSPYYRWR